MEFFVLAKKQKKAVSMYKILSLMAFGIFMVVGLVISLWRKNFSSSSGESNAAGIDS